MIHFFELHVTVRETGIKSVYKVTVREIKMELTFNKMRQTGIGTIPGVGEGGRRMRSSVLTG